MLYLNDYDELTSTKNVVFLFGTKNTKDEDILGYELLNILKLDSKTYTYYKQFNKYKGGKYLLKLCLGDENKK